MGRNGPRNEASRALLRPSPISKPGSAKASGKSGQANSGRKGGEPPALKNVLVLVRHGESEWNRLNLLHRLEGCRSHRGRRGRGPSRRRHAESRGRRSRLAFTSLLKRAQNTLNIILEELGQDDLPIVKDAALNERDYGELVGLNKEEARKRWGDGAGPSLAALLRHRPSRRRAPEGHRGARLPFSREMDHPGAARGQERDRGRPRQLAALAHHAARPPEPRTGDAARASAPACR